jgi:hypothetical protein
MRRNALVMAAGLVMLIAGATPARAQTTSAEVRTWSGQTYQLTEPSLEVLYTIMVPKKDEAGGGAPSDTGQSTGARAPMLFGNAANISQFLEKQPEPLQGQRQSEAITLRQDRSEVRLPLTSVGALFFARQPARSTLPPYIASEQYRYSVIAVLDDGSRVEGDYVNLGTTFLRGRTAHGRVDIPWDQIEIVRFKR